VGAIRARSWSPARAPVSVTTWPFDFRASAHRLRDGAEAGRHRGPEQDTGSRPILMDVRHPEQVRAAVEKIEAHGQGSTAREQCGLADWSIATWSEEELLEIFDVNALARSGSAGMPPPARSVRRPHREHRVPGRFDLEALLRSYTMTKHALEAFTVLLTRNSSRTASA